MRLNTIAATTARASPTLVIFKKIRKNYRIFSIAELALEKKKKKKLDKKSMEPARVVFTGGKLPRLFIVFVYSEIQPVDRP